MAYALITNGSARELIPGQNVELSGGRHTSYGSILVWSDAERAAEGIVEIQEPVIPPRTAVTGRSLRVANGAVIRDVTTQAVPLTTADVNVERDRRLATFTFGGKAYDFDNNSQLNIAGAGILAFAAIINGAQPGDLRWANAAKDFSWVAADNTSVTMDAQTTFAFAQAAGRWKADHIHAGRVIKDLGTIPADYAADARWPA